LYRAIILKEHGKHHLIQGELANSSTVLKQVAMMTSTQEVESGEDLKLNCKVLKLPYADENLPMIFVVPNDMYGPVQLESKLTFTTL
jgi:serine protease inhibitor